MPQFESAVVYDGLPIASGGAHAINRLSAREALTAWRGFLESRAHAVSVTGLLRVDNGPGPAADPGVLRALEAAFPTRSESFVRLHPVPEGRIEDGVELMEEISPQPADRWGNVAVSLGFDAQFLLRSPQGDGPWPGQDRDLFGCFETPTGVRLGNSLGRLTINNRRAMGLMLSIPTATDDDLTVLRPWLQERLPFRLSDKHWTRWTLNKNGKTYRPKRLA